MEEGGEQSNGREITTEPRHPASVLKTVKGLSSITADLTVHVQGF
jgi:hypothetical protein